MIRIWPRRRWTQGLLLASATLLIPYLYSRLVSPWSAVTVHCAESDPEPRALDGKLRIVCFNIAHGRGLATSNWDGGNLRDRRRRLLDIAELLLDLDADVVVLNEVDFDASWSNHVNQAELIAKLANYPHRVEQRNLDVRLLGWTWKFGNAVLSRYPIEQVQLIDLPDYSAWETILAGKKRAIACDLRCGGRTVRVVGAHLSHRSEAMRVQSADLLVRCIRGDHQRTLIAGDLNSTPPGFPNSKADADGRNAISVLDEPKLFCRQPQESPPMQNMLTFPADQPNQVIDWILIPQSWQFSGYRVVPTQLSDHRPIVAEVSVEEVANAE